MLNKKHLVLLLVVVVICSTAALTVPTLVRAFSGTDQDMVRLQNVMSRIKEHYVDEVPSEDLVEGALRGMVESLEDPYSAYLSADDYRDFKASTSGTFGGVGVVITNQDGYVTVVSPIKGTPGERAGLQPADRILKVDGEDIRGLDVDIASRLILGEPGTEVKLEVERTGEQLSFAIIREIIEVNPVVWELLPNKIGYISLSNFNEHATERLKEALGELKDRNVAGIILDLRGNPGGLLNQALGVAREFVPAGPVVFVEERGLSEQRALNSQLRGALWPLVVMVDGGSASAAEIVAGAVQDRGAGLLVGEKTFGKATVQDLYPLSDGGALKITIGRYLTPNGRDINAEGIVPDVIVAAPKDAKLSPLELKRVLEPGMGGLDTAELQKRLQGLGYEIPEIDGVYGDKTVDAIRQIQQENGLATEGIVDKQTLEIINKRLATLRGEDSQLEKAIEVLEELMAERIKKAA